MTSETPGPSVRTTADVEISDHDLLLRLTGPGESHLRLLEKELDVSMGMRGETIRIQGASEKVAVVERVLAELVDVMSRQKKLTGQEIARAARTAAAHPEVRLRELFDDVVLTTGSKRVIAPKGFSQQVYVTAIRKNDIVFGIGPAGTGKTSGYLAMAMAVAALQRNEVKRILLTRPAVEAGEKLGFLPGDLAEKVNPYLRPLYDALHDMMGDDRTALLIEKGTIEVAPLAFMRGRTLNDAFVILDECAEHHDRADEDVSDPPRLPVAGRDHRRHHAGRPSPAVAAVASPTPRISCRTSRASPSAASPRPTWSVTLWCRRSCSPTTSATLAGRPPATPTATRD